MHKLLRTCWLLLFLGSAVAAQAQLNTYSPYSSFGLGELQLPVTSRSFGMGGQRAALSDRFGVNAFNPASYPDVQEVAIDFNGFVQKTLLQDQTQSQWLQTGGMQSINVVFPALHRPFAFSLGLMPYSTMGYSINKTRDSVFNGATKSILQTSTGQGGLNELYFGGGVRLWRRLGLGVNLGYLFGRLDETTTLSTYDLGSNYFTDVQFTTKSYVKALSTRFGILYTDTLGRGKAPAEPDTAGLDSVKAKRRWTTYQENLRRWQSHENRYGFWLIRVGLTGQFMVNPSNERLSTLSWNNPSLNNVFAGTDTLLNADKKRFTIPPAWGAGISVEKTLQYTLSADFSYQDWSQFRFINPKEQFQASYRGAFGLEWIPSWGSARKFFARIALRGGVAYQQSQIVANGNHLSGYSFHFGLGIPVVKIKSKFDLFSRLNVGVAYNTFGTVQNGLVQESGYRLVFGVTILQPWFRRWRYD